MSKLYHVNLQQTAAKTVLIRAQNASKARDKVLSRLAKGLIDLTWMKPYRLCFDITNHLGHRLLKQEVA